ncbi:coiled-coil domain-containing protein 62 isoform 2-T2 [Aulostomus maculatus]
MDGGRGPPPSRGRTSGTAPASLCWLSDSPAEFWHSTPVKKGHDAPLHGSQASPLSSVRMDGPAKPWVRITPPVPADAPFPAEFPANDPSSSTIQRQRRELQLLMAELKDRDRELNVTAASHQTQLHAWEQDRQKMLALEEKCSLLEDELQKRNEVIRVLTRRVWVVESREKEARQEIGAARQQLSELEQKQQHISHKCQDYEEKNQSLNSTVMILSNQVGSLQVKEEELSSMLQLKDKDVAEASSQILHLTGRLRDLETSLTESRSQEGKVLRDLEENRRRYKEARHDVTHLKEELQQQVTQSSSQREEIIRLKQELQLLHRDLALSGEGDSWRDELLELARSKQERTMSELRCLRQVCENQRNDLQLLQLNLDSARESLREKTGNLGMFGSQELGCSCPDVSPSSVRVKTAGPAREVCSPTAAAVAGLRRPVHGEAGLPSTHMTNGDDPLSSSFLQQLLDESRQVDTHSDHLTHQSSGHTTNQAISCGTSNSFCTHKCQQHPKPPATKTSETPIKACHCCCTPTQPTTSRHVTEAQQPQHEKLWSRTGLNVKSSPE